MEEEINNFLSQINIQHELLDRRKVNTIRQMWRENFSRTVKEKTGKWAVKEVDWYAFSDNYTSCFKGVKAEEIFRNIQVDEYYCLFVNYSVLGFYCKGGLLTEIKNYLDQFQGVIDIYIIDKDFNWTMVYTHEESMGLGPYFAYSEQE